jgi:hypothetical protein
MVSALLLAALTSNGVVTVAIDSVPQIRCSATLGCEVRYPMGEVVQKVQVTDPRWQTDVLAFGPTPAGTVKLLPITSLAGDGPFTAELDTTTQTHLYRTILVATNDLVSTAIAYAEPPPKPAPMPIMLPPPPTPAPGSGEALPIDAAMLDWSWTSSGTTPCVAVFAVMGRDQVWCRLHDSTHVVPSAYNESGRARIVLDARVVQDHYLVIQTVDSPIDLEWPNGEHARITRTAP